MGVWNAHLMANLIASWHVREKELAMVVPSDGEVVRDAVRAGLALLTHRLLYLSLVRGREVPVVQHFLAEFHHWKHVPYIVTNMIIKLKHVHMCCGKGVLHMASDAQSYLYIISSRSSYF